MLNRSLVLVPLFVEWMNKWIVKSLLLSEPSCREADLDNVLIINLQRTYITALSYTAL